MGSDLQLRAVQDPCIQEGSDTAAKSSPVPDSVDVPSNTLLQQIRQSISDLKWEHPIEEIEPHLALWRSTKAYNQIEWRDLCIHFGVGGLEDSVAKLNWQEFACSNIESTFKNPGDRGRLKQVIDWERALSLNTPLADREHFDPNPLFNSLYLNWWTKPRVHSPPVVDSSPSTPTVYLSGAFWITDQPDPYCEEDTLTTLEPLRRDVAICSLATIPATTTLTLTFQPDYKDVLNPQFGTCDIHREGGVRVIDVIQAMKHWLQIPLTHDQMSTMVHHVHHQRSGIFRRLEGKTDEATFRSCVEKVFDSRGSLLTGAFAGLELGIRDGLLHAAVTCAPRGLDLSEFSASMIEQSL
ncbi:hypothetical protein FRB94_007231 [Tulasnella sp. JGI-2019a]|nr:hypothetical protein FRB94_007231 [Tulasnella sp. JGI-2019a]KAG9010592.1 hypothetical protein FRB93_003860 [Tulasnella sp. JGI-2019a]